MQLVILDLQVSRILLKGSHLGLKQAPLVLSLFQFASQLSVHGLEFKEGGLLFDQYSLKLLILVLDCYSGLLESSHLSESCLLSPLHVFLAALLHDALLFVNDLSHGHLLVHLVQVFAEHRLCDLCFHLGALLVQLLSFGVLGTVPLKVLSLLLLLLARRALVVFVRGRDQEFVSAPVVFRTEAVMQVVHGCEGR